MPACAAGSAAALDLGLHIVRKDHGAEVANFVSRRLVFAAFRDGGQRQFLEQPRPSTAGFAPRSAPLPSRGSRCSACSSPGGSSSGARTASTLVAHRTGLGTTANLRAQLHRHTGVSPTAYRARFRSSESPTRDAMT